MITQKQIDKWNSTFKEATASEKRILIAKDVLANLKASKIIAQTGIYIDWIDIDEDMEEDSQAQKYLDKIHRCTTCALGAALISCTKFKNTLTIEDLNNTDNSSSDNWKLLKGVFTPKQITMIEFAFEGGDGEWSMRVGKDYFNYVLDDGIIDKCNDFYDKYDDESDRLKAIMNNIIKNNGNFIV